MIDEHAGSDKTQFLSVEVHNQYGSSERVSRESPSQLEQRRGARRVIIGARSKPCASFGIESATRRVTEVVVVRSDNDILVAQRRIHPRNQNNDILPD